MKSYKFITVITGLLCLSSIYPMKQKNRRIENKRKFEECLRLCTLLKGQVMIDDGYSEGMFCSYGCALTKLASPNKQLLSACFKKCLFKIVTVNVKKDESFDCFQDCVKSQENDL